MPREAEPGTAGIIDTEKEFATLTKVFLYVIEWNLTPVGGKTCVEKLRVAFQNGVDMVTRRS